MSRVTHDVSILQQLISSSMMQLFTDFFHVYSYRGVYALD